MRKSLLIAFAALVLTSLNVSGERVPLSEEELVYQAIEGRAEAKKAAEKALHDEKGWQKVDNLELLYFLDNSKPGLNAAVFLGDSKYLHATQAEIIDALLKAIESEEINVTPNYPYRHVPYDGGLKKDAMRILQKLGALEAFKKILFMPLGDDMDSLNQRDFAIDCIIELANTEAVIFFDSVQRNEKHPKNIRIAASRGILRIAEKDKSNKTAWNGVEYAKTHSPSPIVQAQARSLLEGTEDPVRKMAADLINRLSLDSAGTKTSSAETVVSTRNEFGGQTIQSPPAPTIYQQKLQYYDASGRLRRKETVYSKQYAELDGLARQIVDYGIDPGSRVVVNYFSASAVQSNGFDKAVTEFRADKGIRREEFMADAISQRTGLAKKTFHYDQSGKVVQVENLVTQAYAQSKGYDQIVFHYEHKSALEQPSREERRYIQSPANKTALVKLVMFYDTEGSMTKDEQYFTAPFMASQGARLVVSHYSRNRIMTMQEHYFPDEFAKRNGYDLVKLYFDEKEAIVRSEAYRNSTLIKTEGK